MKKLKVFIILTISFTMIIISLNGTLLSKPLSPENTFPVSEDIIKKSLKEESLKWEFKEPQSLNKNSVVYKLYNENDKLIGIVSSTQTENRRILNFNLIDTSSSQSLISEPIQKENWLNAVSLACRLYGGFSDTDKVFTQFIDDTNGNKYKRDDGSMLWHKKIDGKYCLIRLNKSKELNTIIISNKFSYKEANVNIIIKLFNFITFNKTRRVTAKLLLVLNIIYSNNYDNIILSFANSPPLAWSNFSSKSETLRFFFSSPWTS